MPESKSKYLECIIKHLKKANIKFYLLWETAIFAWGISNNSHLKYVDIAVARGELDDRFKVKQEGYFMLQNPEFKNVRFWTFDYLNIDKEIEVTECKRYECFALAPELQLAKLQYFPEKSEYAEDIAKLAASVYADKLTDKDYEYYSQYVRN